jgi:hypothetical protein
MFKPDDPSAVAGAYIDGVPGGAHGTALRADHLNAITNEIANVVTSTGFALDKADATQLYAAIRRLDGYRAEVSGITQWVDLYTSPAAINMNAIAASPLGLLAVGRAATPVPMRLLWKGSYAWETVTPALAYAGVLYDVCWSAAYTRFVTVGAAGEIQDSLDGVGWTRRATGAADFRACAPGTSAVVAVGIGGLIVSTVDGTTWITRTSAHPTFNMAGVVFAASLNRFVAVGQTGKIQRSDSAGATWAAATSPTTADLLGVIWSSERSKFFAWTATEVYQSSDGLAWSAATGPVSAWPTTGGIAKVIALNQHLAVFWSNKPAHVKLYLIDELDGTPLNVTDNLNLFVDPVGEFDTIMSVIRVPPTSGYAFAGRLLSIFNSGRIRATAHLG